MIRLILKIFAYLFFLLHLNVNADKSDLKLPTRESGNHDALCREYWSRRGVLDAKMYSYCMGNEINGYMNFLFLSEKYSNESWIQLAVNFAVNKWTGRDWRQDSMVYRELYLITEGYEDLLYLSQQPKWEKSKYESCLYKWGIQFNNVVRCYKN
jgi:hypothetical protein